jgi:hypothetical protein
VVAVASAVAAPAEAGNLEFSDIKKPEGIKSVKFRFLPVFYFNEWNLNIRSANICALPLPVLLS